MDHMRPRVGDQPGQHGETLCLLKIQKLSWVWWHMPVTLLLGRLRQKNHLNLEGRGSSELRLHDGTPAWATRVKLYLNKTEHSVSCL